ncbi:hypothetical protein F7725_009874 [Dissostichus mawsoni]|uniref:Uncharacterized protein n=1 Tax=Dissostichus mawsoni TaxID=36200 RepID=A0A7J5XLY2_DISMA|nr:hypothetical protein F7725_009874 [Dissostichus mawsoni]
MWILSASCTALKLSKVCTTEISLVFKKPHHGRNGFCDRHVRDDSVLGHYRRSSAVVHPQRTKQRLVDCNSGPAEPTFWAVSVH